MKKTEIPKAIRHIAGLQRAPLFEPGIYFLIFKGEVVYVGQSISPTRRIGDHISEGLKTFDDVFVLDTPKPALDQVESAFIALLKPKYNLAEGRQVTASHASERTVDMLRALAHGARLADTAARPQALPTKADQPARATRTGNRLIRLPEVMDMTGLKKTSVYQRVREGAFPRPVSLGPRTVAWRTDDIDAWVSSREMKAAQAA